MRSGFDFRTSVLITLLLAACSGKAGTSAAADITDGSGNGGSGTAGSGNGGGGNGGGSTDGTAGGGTGGTDGDGAPTDTSLLQIYGIAYGNGRFVAVGEEDIGRTPSGIIYTSTDGDSWERGNTLPGERFEHITFGNGVFLAATLELSVGSAFEYGLRRSTDGKAFTEVTTLPSGTTPNGGFAFGNGVFAVCDTSGSVLTTTDGVTFDVQPDGNCSSIAFGAGLFASTATTLLVSTDAVHWTPRDVVGQTNQNVGFPRGFENALAVSLYDTCCFGEVPSMNRYGRSNSVDGTTWKAIDGGNTPIPMPEFVTETSCIALEPTTFDTPSAPDTPCISLKDDPVVSDIALVIGRALHDGTYVLGGRNGIVTSHDGRTWQRTLRYTPPGGTP